MIKHLGLLVAIGVLVALSVFMLASALYRWDLLWIPIRDGMTLA